MKTTTTKTIEDFKASLHEIGPIILEDMLKAQTGNFLIDRAAKVLLNGPRFKSADESLSMLDSETIQCLEWVIQTLVDVDDTLKMNEELYERNLINTLNSLADLINYTRFWFAGIHGYAMRQAILDTISFFDTPKKDFLINGRDFNDKSYIMIDINMETGRKMYKLRMSLNDYCIKSNAEWKRKMQNLRARKKFALS